MKAFLLVPAALAVAGCASMHLGSHASAVASLEPASGSSVRGSVTFTRDGDEVRVRANVSGLPPNSEHGFHIHDKGDCSSGDGMSTGGHFNPTGKPHGPQSGEHHAGDMPSLTADGYGNATATLYVYVDDADARYQRALEAGATSISEPANQFYGDRHAGVKDTNGISWWIATHFEDVPPDELARRAKAAMEKK